MPLESESWCVCFVDWIIKCPDFETHSFDFINFYKFLSIYDIKNKSRKTLPRKVKSCFKKWHTPKS